MQPMHLMRSAAVAVARCPPRSFYKGLTTLINAVAYTDATIFRIKTNPGKTPGSVGSW